MYVVVVVYFTTFESVILYRNTCRPCYVSKAVIGAVFKSYELLHFLRLNGCVGAIPT